MNLEVPARKDAYARLVAHDRSVADLYPVERYARMWLDAQARRSYTYVAEDVLATDRRIAQAGDHALGHYHRLVLAYLAAQVDDRIAAQRVPESVATLLRAEVERIVADFERHDDAFYAFSNDLFLKDMGLCSLRLLPCGAELVQVDAGVPRGLLFRAGARQFVRGAAFFLFETKGFRPMYALHMDPRNTREFTPEGWDRTYLRIADLLVANPEVKGVFGTAWFYDPAVEAISPHLAYVRRRREENGARNFRYGENEAARSGALATSRTRRRLYEEGRYRPASHYLVWPRQSLLRWAERARRGEAAMPDAEATSVTVDRA